MIRIAHISDLHFSKISLSPWQFFSKEWLGNANLLLNRGKEYWNERPFSLLPIFKEKGITHVIISGDLTTSSSHHEYKVAKRFVSELKEAGMTVFLIPGNHDHYTRRSDRERRFYRYFPTPRGSDFTLEAHGVTSFPLTKGWNIVLVDTSLATSLISSNGLFSETIEKNLKSLLGKINPQENILLVNHFPFFQHDLPKRRLIRGERLHEIVSSYPNVQIYLHGHTHRRTIADLRPNSLPLICDSGSTGHKTGSWNLMELSQESLKLSVHKWADSWNVIDTQTFSFEAKPWYANGLRFKCTGCGKCCTGAGFVWLQEEDTHNLSKHFNLSREAFIKKYTRQVGFDVALLEDPQDGDCVFLKDKRFCEVYEARPKQCRTFPWWPDIMKSPSHWEDEKSRCEGIDHEEAPLIPIDEIKSNLEP